MFVNSKFNLKISLFFFLSSSLLVIMYAYFDHNIFSNQLNKQIYSNMENKLLERERFCNNILDNSNKILYSIRKNELFKNYLVDPTKKQNAIYLLKSVIDSDVSIMQLRYIDKDGFEKIRFDRQKGKLPVLQNEKSLQNKLSRYYFSNSVQKDEKVWFSNLDLNIENGKLDIPFNPTYRAILPIKNKNKFAGILIINYFGDFLLNQLFQMPFYDAILIDSEGFIIKHYNKSKDWSKFQNKPFKIEEKYKKLLQHKVYYDRDFVSKSFELPFYNKLFMILEVNKQSTMTQEEIYSNRANTLISSFILIMFLISVFIYFIFKHLEKQKLSIKILSKEKVKQNDLLIQNSKMAAMGEMIANIAHQWRQPLSVVSYNTINLQRKLRKNKVDESFLNNYILKINSAVENMQTTIEDFSTFFNPSRTKEEFEISQILNETIDMIDKSLQDNSILISFNSSTKYFYTGYKNELKQVMLNILSNAKDAIEENNITNGQIEINIKQELKDIHITIKDNGGGIPSDILDRVFEPYFTTKFKKDGTGIGLYMCKMIIEDHFNGNIAFENIANGVICTLTLSQE
jgi:signal transduction histidine kinase